MSKDVLRQIGKKLRSLRQGKHETLQQIADRAGVSKGLISKIENGHTVPSLPVLLSIIEALEIEVPAFFEGIEYVKYEGYLHKTPEQYVKLPGNAPPGINQLSILEQGFSNYQCQVSLLEIMPGTHGEIAVGQGCTFLYLLDGQLSYHLGEEQLQLHQGDSLFFSGQIPHQPANPHPEMVRMLVVRMQAPYQG